MFNNKGAVMMQEHPASWIL